jgi:hypothetical protein
MVMTHTPTTFEGRPADGRGEAARRPESRLEPFLAGS